jgi:hypothetical protein
MEISSEVNLSLHPARGAVHQADLSIQRLTLLASQQLNLLVYQTLAACPMHQIA